MKDKNNSKIIIIKIGSSVLAKEHGGLDDVRIENIIRQIDSVQKKGYSAILVSSGAIAAGVKLLGLSARPDSLPQIQACAAVGQPEMMRMYSAYFGKIGLTCAQVLLTRDDINNRVRYLNARNTILTLLKNKVVPIINENDTVSVEEIKFGDNDMLSSLVSNLVEADKLIIMSDVDGLYKFDLKDKTKKEVLSKVETITEDIEQMAIDDNSKFGRGGMFTKLQAAKIVNNVGIECIILNGKKDDILIDLFNGKQVGTVFQSKQPKISARKRWIAYSLKSNGIIKVDLGAKEVLIKKNRSLLASGVVGFSGKFDVGDAVVIADENNKEFARGITNYSSEELNKIKGLNTKDIEKALGYKYYDEIIHRDNLVIL